MKVGFVLRLNYTYADPDAGASNLQSGTTFQWFTYTLEDGTGKTAIPGATGNTLPLVAAYENLYIGVEIKPRNAGGEIGATVEWRAFSLTNKNKVLKNTFTCGKAGGGTVSFGNNLDASAPLCSPRIVNWQIDYTGVDYSNAFPPLIFINWGDGGGSTQYAPGLINPLLTRNDTINLTNQSNQLWRTNQSHTFNYTTTGGTSTPSATANQVCTYNIQVTWGVGASCAAAAPGNVQTAPFTVWDRENNTSLGTFDINHTAGTGGVEVGEVTNICEKDQTAVRVQDASDFNCTSVGGIRETVTENTEGRWMQWVYGTAGTDVATGPGATEKIVINGTSYTLAQMPVYGRVWWQPPATSAPAPAVTDDIIMPTSGLAPQKLIVTLRSWNYCNQLDRTAAGFSPVQGGANNVQDLTSVSSGVGSTQPILYTPALFNKPAGTSIYANAQSVDRTYTIQLITKPAAPTYPNPNFCEINGGSPTNADYNITFGNGAAGMTLNVYLTNLATLLRSDNASPFTFNPVTDPAVAANRIDVTPPPANPAVYHRYATYTASNNCVSDPLDIVLNIMAQKTGGVYTHPLGASPQNICTGTDPAAFATVGAGTSNPAGGDNNVAIPATIANDVYQWQSSPDNSAWTDIPGATSLSYDPPALTATTYFRRRVRDNFYDITGGCDEAFSNVFQFVVHTTPTGGTIGNPQILCAGVTVPGQISSTGAGTGGNGTPSYSWQLSTDNFAADINTIVGANAATYTPPSPLAVTTYYRRVNTSGVCATNFAYSNVITLTVQPAITPGVISSDQAICFNQTPTGLTGAASTGGNGSPTYQWEISTTAPGTAGFSNVGGATGQNYNPPALTQTTWYRRLTTAGVCAAQYSNTVQITVNPLPTVSGVTGGGAVCSGNPAPDITFTFTGTAPFNFTIDVNNVGGDPDIVVTNHNSTTYTIVDPTPLTNTTYKIISLTDANSCTATTLGATAAVTIGGSAPAFDVAPALAATAVCLNGASTTDPSLSFSLNVTGAGTYVLTYKADGSANRTKNFTVNAVSGDVTAPITFNDAEFNSTAPSPHVLTIVSIVTPASCQTVFNTPLNFTVNPLPVGVNKTITAACTPYAINIDPQATSVATLAGGNGVASTFTWTAVYNGLTGMAASGNGNITGTLTNPTNTVRNAVFTVTPTSTATPACPGSTFTITVPVNPLPTIFNQTPTICSGTAFSITPADGNPSATTIVPAGTTYTWTITPNANITGASNQAAPQASIGQTLTNTTNVQQAITYTVTPKAAAGLGGCTGATFSVDVTVNPTPVIFNRTAAICSGTAFSITPANGAPAATTIVPLNTTYSWPAPVVTGGITGGSAAAGQTSISQTLTNPSTSPATATYTVTPTSGAAGTCVGATFQVVVTVNPIPALSSSLTPPGICTGSFSYHPTSFTAGATFSWSRGVVTGIAEGATSGSGDILDPLTNATTAPIDVPYTVITHANSCDNLGQTVTVRVNPTPVGNAVVGPSNVCAGTSNPFFYSVTQHPGSTYSWDIPATFTVEAAGGGAVPGGGPGAFTADYFILLKFSTATPPGGLQIKVTEKSADGCVGSPNPLTIIAATSPPTVPITGGNSFCKGQTGIVFSVPQNANSTFTWSVGAGASIDGPSAGTNLYQIIVDFGTAPSTTIDVTETNITGCPASYPTLNVTLVTAPVGSNITRAPQCSNVAFNVSADNVTNGVTGSTFTWLRNTLPAGLAVVTAGTGTGNIAEKLVNLTGASLNATYTVTPTGSTGCVGPTYVVTVPVNPEPVGSNVISTAQCSNVAFNIDPNHITNGLGGASTYAWVRNALPAGLAQVAAGSGTGMISETLRNLTSGQLSAVYVVTPTTFTGCAGGPYTVTVPVNPEPVGADITRAAQCSNVSFSVSAVNITNGIGATSSYTWVRNSLPAGLTVVSAGTGTGGTITETLRNLTGGQLTATYTVTPKSVDNCTGATYVISVPIDSEPVGADITRAAECSSVAFNVTPNNITNGMGATSTYTWVRQALPAGLTVTVPGSGSGLINETLRNVTSAPISAKYTVTPKSAAGCTGATYVITIPVNPEPVGANITRAAQCSNVAFSVSPDNITNGLGGTSTYSWTRNPLSAGLTVVTGGTGTGAIAETLRNLTSGQLSATYTVVATSGSGCASSSYVITIPINPEPVGADITRAAQCSNVGFSLSADNLSNGLGATSTYTWVRDPLPAGLTQVTAGSGNGAIAETLRNQTNSTLSAVYVVTPTSSAGCVGATYKITVPVSPEPVGAGITRAAQCSDVPFSLSSDNITNGVVGTTFTWVRQALPVGLTVLSGGSGVGTIDETLRNLTGGTLNAVYRVTPTLGSCVGQTYDVTVPVNPEPVGANFTRAPQCSNVTFSVSANNITNGVAGVTFTWTRNTLPAGLTQITAGTGIGAIAETLENKTGVQLSATYVVTPTSGAGCVGGSYVITVPVNPEPVGASITRAVQCSNVPFSVSADNITNGLGATSTYTWVRNALPAGLTQVTAGTGSGAIAETLRNLTSAQLSATYVVTPTSSNGCVGATYVITVPVNPEPVGADITRAAQCSNVAFSVSANNITNGVTGSTFTWIRNTLPVGITVVTAGSGTGAIAETLKNITSASLNATYTVTATANGCPGVTYIITVPINPEPVGASITRAAQCSNVPFSVSANNITNGVAGPTFTWVRNTLPAGIGLVTAGTGTGPIAETLRNLTGAQLSATYTVTPTSAAGCTGATYVITVPVNPEPVGANITIAAQCSNVGFSIDPNNVTNGLGSTSTYTWVRNALPVGLTQVTGGTGTGMIAETLRNLTSAQLSAVYVVTPTSPDGCVGATYNVTVPVNPEPVGADITRAAQCSNVSFSVSAVNISNGLGATSSYTWTRNTLPAGLVLISAGTGTGSTITETLRNLTGGQLTVTYVVTPKSSDNCTGATYVISVPIDSEPVGADITRAAECSSVGFNVDPNNITNGMGATSTYTWVRQALPAGLTVAVPGTGTGTISETLRNLTSSPLSAKYTVTPHSAAGCNGVTYVITVPVNPEPVGANITRAAQCSNVAFSVSADNITNGLGATSTYTWTRNPLSAGLTVVTAGTGTGPIAETLRNLTSGQLSASYTVTATSASGCASSAYIVTVPVNPEPVGVDVTRAAQCSNVAFSLSADNITNGLGGSSTFTWVRDPLPAGLTQVVAGTGTGAIAETLRNLTSGSLNAVYTVSPKSSSGCFGDTYKITIPISPEPVGGTITRTAECSSVAYSVSPDNITNGVVGATFTWVRQALPVGLTALSAGSGSGSIDETMRNLTSGVLNVTYRITPTVGGCAGQTYDVIVPVNPEPVGVNVTRAAQCSNLPFNVSANSITNSVAGVTFTWTRNTLPAGLIEITAGTGIGAIAEKLENKTSVQLSATYVVTPTSGAGCVGGSYVVTVPINPQPVGADITRATQCSNVAFSVSADNITNGLGATSSYTWLRNALPAGLTVVTPGTGNGAIAETLRNQTGGTLNATYTVTPVSSSGCPGDTYVITVPISPEPVGAAITRAAECSNKPFSVSADNITNGVVGTTFTWVRQTLPVGLTQVTGGSGIGAIAETLRNITSASLDAKYTVTPTTGGCVGATYVITIPINPEPVGVGITRAVQCSNQAFSVSPDNITNGVTGSTFTWVRDNLPVGLSLVTAGTGSGAIAETIRNITGGQLSATYKVTPTSAAGCVGAVYTITVPINPEPVGNNITRTAECSNVAFNVDPNNITNGLGATSTFTWVRDPLPAGLTQVTAGTGTGMIAEKLRNLTSGQLNATYKITPTSVNGCVGDVYTVTIPVSPEPVGADITRAAQCSNIAFSVSAVNITNSIGGTSTYTWVRNALPAGLTVVLTGTGTGTSINETLRNLTGGQLTATYTVTPKSADGCFGATYVVSVPVDSEPVGVDITRAAQCSGVLFSVSADNLTNGMGATSTYAWVRQGLPAGLTVAISGNGTGLISEMLRNTTSGQLSAKYTVTPRTAAGCFGATYVITIPIDPEPLGANFTRAEQCSNVPFSVSADNISNGLGATSTYTWIRNPLPGGLTQVTGGTGTGLIAETLRNLSGTQLTASYVVTPTSAAGCVGGSYTIFVPINSEPVGGDFTAAQACSNVSFTVISNNITNGLGATSTYSWVRQALPAGLTVVTPGGGTGNITETLRNLSSGQLNAKYTITPKSSNGCDGVPYVVTVPVNPEPVGGPITRPAQCSDSPFNLSADNITNGVIGVTFAWVRKPLPAGLTVTAAGTGSGNIAETLRNLTGATLNAVYTVTPTAGVCAGATYEVTVPISGEPVMATDLDQTRCSDVAYGRVLNTNGSSEPAASYDVEVMSIQAGLTGTRTVGMVGTGLPANAIQADVFTNTTLNPLKVVYKVTPHGLTCIGDPILIEFIISPEPVIPVITPAAVCSRATTSITLSTNGTSVAAQSYELTNIQYSLNGAAFSTTPPLKLTPNGGNRAIGSTGDVLLLSTDTYINLEAFFVDVKYTVVPRSSAGCAGDARDITIRVNPEPDLDNALSPSAICSGETIVGGNPGFLLKAAATSVAATTFIIHSINAPGLTPGPSNETTGTGKPADAINDDSWVNVTSGPLPVTYEISPVTGTCIGQKEIVTLNVNPSPAMKDGLSRFACSDSPGNIVLQDNSPTSVIADRFDIISITVGGSPITPNSTVGGLFSRAGNSVTGITTNANAIKNDIFENATNDRIVVTYTIVPISPAVLNSCRGPAKVITLTVEPRVKSLSTLADNDICSGQSIDLTFVSPTYNPADPTNPTVTFSYATLASPISGATVGNNLVEGTHITDVLVNTTNAPIVVTYRITPRASAASNGVGCDGAFQDITVTVQPRPKINAIANKTICDNTPVNLNLVSPTIPASGSIKIFVTSTSDPLVTGASNNVLVTNNTLLGDVLMNPTDILRFVTYHLEVRNVDGTNVTICDAPAIDVTVGVSPRPKFVPVPANFAICSGDSFNAIPITTNTGTAVPGSTIVSWTATPNSNVSGESPGAGDFSQVLFNNTNNKQVVTYTINASNIGNSPSCAATPHTLLVTVYPNPKATNIPTTVNVCNNGTLPGTPFTITASTVAALGTTFDWPVPDNGSNPLIPPAASGTNATTIPQVFVNNDVSQGTQTYSIKGHLTMNPADQPLIDASQGLDAVCESQADAVMVVNVAPPVGGDIYGFDIDGNVATDLFLCRGSTQLLTVEPIGLPLLSAFYKENGGPEKQLVKLGGSTTLKVTPTTTTTYELTRVVDAYGCPQAINKTVTVNVDEVDNNLTIVGPNAGCSPFTVTFQHNQVAGRSYTWKWADGPDSTTYLAGSSVGAKHIKHVYNNLSPSSTVNLKATVDVFLDTTKYINGCRKKRVDAVVKLFPTVSDPQVFPDKDIICSGETVTVTNSTQGASQHHWSYRVQGSATDLEVQTTQGAKFKIPNTSNSNPLIYEIVYQGKNASCPAKEIAIPITVYRGVDAHFTHTTPTLFVGGHSSVTFTNDSAPVDAGDFNYDWEFGLNSNPETENGVGPYVLDYTTPGPKEIRLVVTNVLAESDGLSCADEFTETINIAVLPLLADFVAVPLKACFPTDITITENHATGDKFEWRVLDNAGTAATSNADLPVFKIPAPGKYTVELTTSNSFTGDQKTVKKDILIYDLPMASFDFRPGLVYVPDTELTTYNFSDGATSYVWDFGDGTTDDTKEPTHTYKIEGVYDITLIAMNDHGENVVCMDTLVRKVTAKQGGVTRVPNAFTPNPNGPTSSAGTPGIPGSNSFNDVFLPQVKGAEEFNMQVFDRWGNMVFESNNSNVGWDGYDKNGRLMPAGVYVYKLTLRLSDGQRTTQVGDITMIR